MTKEFTENLEKLIKQRCMDEAWDDRIVIILILKENSTIIEYIRKL